MSTSGASALSAAVGGEDNLNLEVAESYDFIIVGGMFIIHSLARLDSNQNLRWDIRPGPWGQA